MIVGFWLKRFVEYWLQKGLILLFITVLKMTLEAIKWENGKLRVLDQTLLPLTTIYIDIKGVEDGWKIINRMQVVKIIIF